MTSISSLSGAMHSPRSMMDQRISDAVSSGALSSTDQSALGTALDAIDQSLEAERSSGGKPSGDMKSKIDGLIQAQVEAGTLSEDQASELQSFFAQGPDGKGGPGGPPPPPPSDATSSEDSDSTSKVSDAASTQLEALEAFLEKLREGQAAGSTTYGSSATSKTSTATGIVLDSLA